MNEEKMIEKMIVLIGVTLFIQLIWLFVALVLIKPFLIYTEYGVPNYVQGCTSYTPYFWEHLRDMFIMFIPSFVYVIGGNIYLFKKG